MLIFTSQQVTEETYARVESDFFREATRLMGDNLLLYCVTGSLGRNHIVPNWSDIDILLVVERYDSATLAAIQQAIYRTKSPIKVGTTSYSRPEFGNLELLDTKTLLAIRGMRRGVYTPRVRATSLRMPHPTERLIRAREEARFPELLHMYKRCIQEYSPQGERKLYKQMTDLLKIAIRRQAANVDPLSYEEVLVGARTYLEGCSDILFLPRAIMEDEPPAARRLQLYYKILALFTEKAV